MITNVSKTANFTATVMLMNRSNFVLTRILSVLNAFINICFLDWL